jgi:hypothetical protein
MPDVTQMTPEERKEYVLKILREAKQAPLPEGFRKWWENINKTPTIDIRLR